MTSKKIIAYRLYQASEFVRGLNCQDYSKCINYKNREIR